MRKCWRTIRLRIIYCLLNIFQAILKKKLGFWKNNCSTWFSLDNPLFDFPAITSVRARLMEKTRVNLKSSVCWIVFWIYRNYQTSRRNILYQKLYQICTFLEKMDLRFKILSWCLLAKSTESIRIDLEFQPKLHFRILYTKKYTIVQFFEALKSTPSWVFWAIRATLTGLFTTVFLFVPSSALICVCSLKKPLILTSDSSNLRLVKLPSYAKNKKLNISWRSVVFRWIFSLLFWRNHCKKTLFWILF